MIAILLMLVASVVVPVAVLMVYELALAYAFGRRWHNGYSTGAIPRSWQNWAESIGYRQYLRTGNDK